MQYDPTAYILAAALLSGSIGFFAASLCSARIVRRANLEGWKECVKFYQQRQTETKETPRL